MPFAMKLFYNSTDTDNQNQNQTVTKRLWQRRFRWDTTAISQAHPQQHFTPKPPNSIEVIYPFSTDFVLREHYRNPWNGVRIGRMLEDADSLAGFVSYEHCDDTNPTTRPPLLVTATVEAIKLTGSDLSLEHDMTLRGKVVWTGTSSLDINMELIQHGVHKMSALFTFVARDPVTGASQRVNPLKPEKPQDQEVFCERQRVNDVRKSERTAIKQGKSVLNSPEIQQYIADLLASARTKRELPALAEPHTLFADQTMCSNTFTTQPQQRNLHGRVFGGFLMRRAFELAHSTAYQFAGCRPRTLLIDQIEFRKPVNIGDLLRLNAWVLHTRPHPKEPHSKGGLFFVSVFCFVVYNARGLFTSLSLKECAHNQPTNKDNINKYTMFCRCIACTSPSISHKS